MLANILLTAVTIALVGLNVGDQAKEIKAAGLLNATASSPRGVAHALKAKRIVLVEFWATWCPPCRRSIPHLEKIHQKYKDKGLVIFGLSSESRSKVQSFMKTMKMTYLVAYGSNSGRDYGVRGIPHAFLIGLDGKITWKGHPLNPQMEKKIAEAVAKLSSAPGGAIKR